MSAQVYAAAGGIPAQRPDFIGFGLTAVDYHIVFVLVRGRTIMPFENNNIVFKIMTYLA